MRRYWIVRVVICFFCDLPVVCCYDTFQACCWLQSLFYLVSRAWNRRESGVSWHNHWIYSPFLCQNLYCDNTSRDLFISNLIIWKTKGLFFLLVFIVLTCLFLLLGLHCHIFLMLLKSLIFRSSSIYQLLFYK